MKWLWNNDTIEKWMYFSEEPELKVFSILMAWNKSNKMLSINKAIEIWDRYLIILIAFDSRNYIVISLSNGFYSWSIFFIESYIADKKVAQTQLHRHLRNKFNKLLRYELNSLQHPFQCVCPFPLTFHHISQVRHQSFIVFNRSSFDFHH